MTEYKETIVPDGDERTAILDTMARNRPWALVTADLESFPDIGLTVEVGGGISDVKTLRALLVKTLNALPLAEE